MRFLCLAFALVAASSAQGTPLSVRIQDSSGRAVTDAVVLYYPSTGAAAPRPTGRYTVSQKALQFHPFVSIVPVGATVSFPNLDPTKHHVYSFSRAKRFELKLFAKDQSRSVQFDKPGPVALGCNIHDQMSAFIYVADTRWTGQPNRNGLITLERPSGTGRLVIWHPYLRSPGGTVSQMVAPNESSVRVKVSVRPPPPAMLMKEY